MIGKNISHYKILEKVGEGGMGVIYKAHDTKLDRTVALKFLPKDLAFDDEAKTRFIHEAKAASALDHPNIATVYEIDEVEGESFISMAYVEGKSLKELAGGSPLPMDKVLDLAIQIAAGLGEAHEHDIVHRDIKSDNIMVTPKGLVKIMDFGLAKLRGVSRVTTLGSTLGTIAYMSPEQAKGADVDHRSDIFSFGVVLYEMITGHLPFSADHEAALLYSIVNTDPKPLHELRSEIPVRLEEIVSRAMEKDLPERYQSMREMLADLKGLRDGLRAATVTAGIGGISAGRPRSNRSKVLVPLAAVAVVAAGLLIGIRIQIGRQPAAEAAGHRLAIMYFENLAQPDDPGKLGEIVTNLLITDLSESRQVQVVSSQRLYDILKQLGREGEKVIDRNVASQVAEKAGAKWMLLGSIPQVEPRTILLGQLIDVSSGDVVASQRIEAASDDDVFALVDRMTIAIKDDLSLPSASLSEADLPVADVTTHSEEAYRYFLEGEDLIIKFYGYDALRSFQKAVELDSTLAMAYAYMGTIASNIGDERAWEWIASAKRHSDKTTEMNRAFIDYVEAHFLRDYPRIIEICERTLERWPDNKDARFSLGRVYQNSLERPEVAISHYLKVLEMDPLHKLTYNQLAYAYNDLGEYEKSIWAINKYISIAPGEANPYDSRGDIYAQNGKLDLAIESYREALEIKPDMYITIADLGVLYIFKRDYAKAESTFRELFSSSDKSVRSQGRFHMALIPLHQGKLKEAAKTLDEGISADEMEGVAGIAYAQKHFQRAYIQNEWGDPNSALRGYEVWLGILDKIRPLDAVKGRHIYVRFLAENGLLEEAERVTAELKRDIESKDPVKIGYYWSANSFLERSRGDSSAAAESMRKALETRSWNDFPGLLLAGRSFLEDGDLGEAVEYLERASSIYSDLRGDLGIWSTKVHYFLGLAYEESGWTDKAVAQYEEFLEIWKDADSDLDEAQDAKERLAALKVKS
jgi:tetratricopeptide (TPR) repeat protein/predicted Ser/Thr protein kinase